jgi:hypothetical protein
MILIDENTTEVAELGLNKLQLHLYWNKWCNNASMKHNISLHIVPNS